LQDLDSQRIFSDPECLCTQVGTQVSGGLDPDLSRIVSAWRKLPDVHKQAIIGIVGSIELRDLA